MRQFYSPRTRLFRKRRFRIRYAVLPLLFCGALALAFGGTDGQGDADRALAVDSAEQTVALPQDIPALDETSPARAAASGALTTASGTPDTESAARSLRAAFEAVPQKSDFVYHHRGAAPAETDGIVSRRLTALHSGITALLDTTDDDKGDAPATASAETPAVQSRTVPVGRGDTLMDLLVRNNVPRAEAHQAITALSKIYDPRGLNPRHEITVFFHRDPHLADPRFQGLQISTDILNTVSVNRDSSGSYIVNEATRETQSVLQAVAGEINGSLYVAARGMGVPDAVILEMIKMYSAHVDFQRDVQAGDAFEVLFEQVTTDSGEVVPGRGNILFARMNLSGRDIPLYRFEDKNGITAYYDAEGKSARRSLMRTPIDGARISSGYGQRKHPILGYNKMHRGIDFAAPRGTPIYAAGDGRIARIGVNGGYGKYIRINHGNGLATAYAHMHRFRDGLKTGSAVKQGQVIGYVGTTGRSTGPHLHYEVLRNGQQVNPRSINTPQGRALAGAELDAFKAEVARINRTFDDTVRALSVAGRNEKGVQTAEHR